nr:Chain u, ARX1 [Saccharomyces cerevisiae S288C]
KDKNILQESVLNKYRTAGQIAQTALKYVTSLINDSYHSKTTQRQLTVPELCLLTDSFILTRLEQYYKNKVNERGIAIPTTIDIDQISGGWCPEIDDVTGTLRPGDLVKITLGVHIDGYTSEVSHTMVIYPVDETKPILQPTGPLLGGKADAVAAAHIAMETVVALLSSGITGQLIRTIVDTIARSYNCGVVPGSRVRRIRRFLAGQNEGIVAEFTNVSAIPSDDFVVQSGEVYLIDLKMASLEHKAGELIARPGAYVRDFAQTHILKLKTSRQLLTKIDKQGVYPFKLSHLLKSFRLGMSEISNNYLCVESPIQIARTSTLVARECNTIVLCDSSVSTTDRPELLRLTGGSKTCQPSWIHSQHELNPQDSIVQGIFQLAT